VETSKRIGMSSTGPDATEKTMPVEHKRIWMTSGEASRMLGISAHMLHKLADNGDVGSLKLPGVKGRRFKIADVERLVRESTTPARERTPELAVN
jgi:excisionase family DNA binding protein